VAVFTNGRLSNAHARDTRIGGADEALTQARRLRRNTCASMQLLPDHFSHQHIEK
jgi:hypothetical protein